MKPDCSATTTTLIFYQLLLLLQLTHRIHGHPSSTSIIVVIPGQKETFHSTMINRVQASPVDHSIEQSVLQMTTKMSKTTMTTTTTTRKTSKKKNPAASFNQTIAGNFQRNHQ